MNIIIMLEAPLMLMCSWSLEWAFNAFPLSDSDAGNHWKRNLWFETDLLDLIPFWHNCQEAASDDANLFLLLVLRDFGQWSLLFIMWIPLSALDLYHRKEKRFHFIYSYNLRNFNSMSELQSAQDMLSKLYIDVSLVSAIQSQIVYDEIVFSKSDQYPKSVSGHQSLFRLIHGLWPQSPEVGQHDIFIMISPNVWTRTTGPIAEKEIYKSRHRS